MNNFGIIQGRLTKSPKGILQYFPKNKWKNEFKNAKKLGFNSIEIFADRTFNPLNPIWNDKGLDQILNQKKINKISTSSFCDDFIINNKLKNIKDFKKLNTHFKKIFKILKILKCKIFILPFLDKSELNSFNYMNEINLFRDIAIELNKIKITLCVETLLSANNLKKLINKVSLNNFKCVYDTGNRVNLEKNYKNDIALLKNDIAHVHLKDKDDNDQNVILGSGNVNFYDVFYNLKKINYKGDYIFETNRGVNALETAKFNLTFSKFYINQFK